MRKVLIILAALFVIGAAGTFYVNVQLKDGLDNVGFSELLLKGSDSGADGISITVRSFVNESVSWENTLSFEDGIADVRTVVSTKLPEEGERRSAFDTGGVHLDSAVGGVFVGNSFAFAGPGSEKGNAMLEELKKEAAASGKTAGRMLYLNEIYDYYPFSAWVSVPEGKMIGSSSSYMANKMSSAFESYMMSKMQEYFRIPVLEEDHLLIEYSEKNGQNLYRISRQWSESDEEAVSFNLYTDTRTMKYTVDQIITEDSIYFWFNNLTNKGTRVDTSLIPGGYGIYRLPYGYVDSDDYLGLGEVKGYVPFFDEMETVFSAGSETTVLGSVISEDGDKLITVLLEDGQITATVSDIDTHEVLQHFVLEESDEVIPNGVYGGKGAVIYRKGYDSFGTILRCDNGEYKKGFSFSDGLTVGDINPEAMNRLMSGDLGITTEAWLTGYKPAISYDGNRLTVCFVCITSQLVGSDGSGEMGNYVDAYAYELIVCSEKGVEYEAWLTPDHALAGKQPEGSSMQGVRPDNTASVVIN